MEGMSIYGLFLEKKGCSRRIKGKNLKRNLIDAREGEVASEVGYIYLPKNLEGYFGLGKGFGEEDLIQIVPYFVGTGIHNLSFFRIIQDGEEFLRGYYHKPKFLNDLKISRFLKGEEYIENAGGKIIADKNGLGFLLREMNNEFLDLSSSISRELEIHCAHCLMHNDGEKLGPIKYH